MKINHLFLNQFKIFTHSPLLIAVIFSEELFRSEPMLVEKVSEIMNNSFNVLIQYIKYGQEFGELHNDVAAEHSTVFVMGSLSLFVKKMINIELLISFKQVLNINTLKIRYFKLIITYSLLVVDKQ